MTRQVLSIALMVMMAVKKVSKELALFVKN
jgi:hypothetical protein